MFDSYVFYHCFDFAFGVYQPHTFLFTHHFYPHSFSFFISDRFEFYFFDIGVRRQLDRTIESKLIPSTIAYGEAFEHFVILEIMRLASYAQKNWSFSYFQTKEGNEIDLIISLDRRREILIEIKSTTRIEPSDFKYLNDLSQNFKAEKVYVFSLDKNIQKIENVRCVPWDVGLKELFSTQ